MNRKYIEDFKRHLINKGYDGHFEVGYKESSLYGLSYWFVDILGEDSNIIQVFILLSTSQRTNNKRYPIWESYDYKEGKNGYRVYPAVFIVTQCDDGKWIAYSASDTNNPKDSDSIINYRKACGRFKRRVDIIDRYDRIVKTLKWICWCFSIILSTYLIGHIATSNSAGEQVLPLTSQMVLLICLIVFITILPIMFPYIKSFSINGIVDVDIGDNK